jgi:hypothetical protein
MPEIDINGEKIPVIYLDWDGKEVIVACNGYDCKWGPPGIHTQDRVPYETFVAYYTGTQRIRNWKGTTFEGQPNVIEKHQKLMNEKDAELLKEMYDFAYKTAKNLTGEETDLFKTTYQCIFWEAAHFLFGKKLKEYKVRD